MTVAMQLIYPARARRLGLLGLGLAGLFGPAVALAATVTGNVSNLATGNLLEGARVEIPAIGASVLTDSTGRYVLPALPGGTHENVVTYTGWTHRAVLCEICQGLAGAMRSAKDSRRAA